jgi:photosystem II stability/assembly factor-like uncharacterized protein
MSTVLYLGTDEGVVTLRQDNGGPWKLASHGLRDWEITEVAAGEAAPNQVLAGTRGDGVWLSEDFGESWRKPSYGKRGPGKVRCVTVDPHNPRRIYAGCEPIDIFVSDDLGASWRRLDSVWEVPWVETVPYPVATVEPHVRDIAVDPKDPNTLYAALQVGYILKSTDGGASWKLLDKDFDCDVHTMAIHPGRPKTMLIATGGHDSRKGSAPGRALYKTDDGGDTWSPIGMEFSQEYSVPLVMNPQNPDVLYSSLAHGQPNKWRRPTGAECVVIRSGDGGCSWSKLDLGGELGRGFVEAIAVDPSSSDRLYAACRSGELLSSDDGGSSWQQLEPRVSAVANMKCVSA